MPRPHDRGEPESVELEFDGRTIDVHLYMRGTDGAISGGPLCALPVLRASLSRDAARGLVLDVEFRGNGPAQGGSPAGQLLS